MTSPTSQQLLKLQRMETTLVRAVLAHPKFLLAREYQQLRYLLGFARLHVFAPGAVDGARRRADVAVDQDILAPLREQVLQDLYPCLRRSSTRERLSGCSQALAALQAMLGPVRKQLLERHCNDFSEAELDAEVGRRALVTVMGGGGGAGYVYIGAAARLRAQGMASDYLVGSSIGALIGAVLSRSRQLDVESLLAWAKSLRVRDLFARPYVGATHTLPGLTRLHLKGMHQLLSHADGSPLRLKDLEIPYEAVTAGVRTAVYQHLPATLREVSAGRRGKSFSKLLSERMLLLGALVTPHVMRAIVLGRDDTTADVRVVDAVGLSAAIPAVLQYEPPQRDAQTDAILARIREQEQVALFVDGAMASNVPARIAWEGVQAGRIGTRNSFVLALDCFHPQWDARHLWLWPVAQAVQLQLPPQRMYYDWLMQFSPTLSPVNLLPSNADFDQAFKWGWQQADIMLPFLLKALEPVSWQPT
ncbi:MAG TPA: patatin-like phospholipase family protein [Stenotrophobium sp.]|nr:patatin-like phospholipase family protein [Stenotrophobium sp.]